MKTKSDKALHRRRKLSLAWYEIGRRIYQSMPFLGRPSKHGANTIRKKQLKFIWTMLAIPIVHFLIFWVYVNIDSILLAFRNIDYAGGGNEYWTVDNFKEVYSMFAREGAGGMMVRYGINTLIFWLLGTVWGIPHSIILTYVFHKKLKGRKFFRVMLYIPSIICGAALAAIFASAISDSGIFGYMLKNVFGMERIPNWFGEQEYAFGGLLFWNFFFGFAGQYILYSGALANVDQEITEAAYMDGVCMWQEMLYIDIPLMWPTISQTIITSFAGLFGASGPILLFTATMESTWTFGYWIFDQVRVYQNYYIPAALGLCFTIIAFPIAQLMRRKLNNMFTTE